MQEFYDELVQPEFQLYLFFLSATLPILANINQQLQKSDLDLFTAYQKISCFSKVFLKPILHNVDIGMQDENIRTDIDDIDYDISVFRQFKDQSVSSGQISYARLHTVMKNCFEFKYAIESL